MRTFAGFGGTVSAVMGGFGRMLVVSMVALAGCATVGRPITGVNNFATVEAGLHRGAQPSAAGFAELARRGVKTVVNLRDDPVPDERAIVERAGMTYINIPMNAAAISAEKAERCLQQLQAAPRPIFLHCRHGRDRTGLEIAMYRIVAQGWPRERAIEELYAHGYHWMFFPGIARYVRTFKAPVPSRPVLAVTR